MAEYSLDLSIVIVSWNVRDLLRSCLRSVYAFTRDITFEVVVVDNASDDGSAAIVSEEFPRVHLIANTSNRGFASANNQALHLAQGRYSLLLNPDTQLTGNAFKAMVDFLDRNQRYAALAPRLTFADGSLQHSCRPFPSFFTDLMESLYLDGLFPRSRFFNRHKLGLWAHDRMREVDQAYGACLCFRSAVLRELGYFDERFFMYFDETDLCYRLKQAGKRLVFVPQIAVIHHSNRSSQQVPDVCHRWKMQSQVYYFRKHYGPVSLIALMLNCSLRSLIVFGFFRLTRALLCRPRHLRYFESVTISIWREYWRSFTRYSS